jgi:acylphosphatase
VTAEYQSRKAFKVHGRVQGVGFRWWAQRQARSLGLTGVVRNLPDGTVEISFAGADEAVQEMCGRLQRGPTAAFVGELEELPAPDQFPDTFQIGF